MVMQTGALPWRLKKGHKPEVLLVTARRSGRWTIPKGWPMLGKSMADAAAIEAFEEAGIKGIVRKNPLGSFRHTKRSWLGNVEVDVLVHPFAVEVELEDWPERGQRERRWFPLKEAASVVESGELQALLVGLDREIKTGRFQLGPA